VKFSHPILLCFEISGIGEATGLDQIQDGFNSDW
jgi:hypothetical protein